MCDACCVDSCNRVRRSTEFLHGDCREPVRARQASWYLVVQVHNAPAEKKITEGDEVVSQKALIIQSNLNHCVNAYLPSLSEQVHKSPF